MADKYPIGLKSRAWIASVRKQMKKLAEGLELTGAGSGTIAARNQKRNEKGHSCEDCKYVRCTRCHGSFESVGDMAVVNSSEEAP